MRIRFSIVGCSLGHLLVAATPDGICTVRLGDSQSTLEDALRAEHPNAELQRDDENLQPWVQALLRHLEGQQPYLDLPLDVPATAFQRRVWDALRAIPYGQTRTYAEVAAAIGQPAAARAVGRACATNPVALIIPCHRVVRRDESLSGYRWALERKQKLLVREKSFVAQTGESLTTL